MPRNHAPNATSEVPVTPRPKSFAASRCASGGKPPVMTRNTSAVPFNRPNGEYSRVRTATAAGVRVNGITNCPPGNLARLPRAFPSRVGSATTASSASAMARSTMASVGSRSSTSIWGPLARARAWLTKDPRYAAPRKIRSSAPSAPNTPLV